MNLPGIPSDTLVGRVARLPLRAIPRKDARLPILQGRLRGKRSIVGRSTHGCWLGSNEYEKRCLFERAVGEGDVVYWQARVERRSIAAVVRLALERYLKDAQQ